jgi:hypothetical protein
VDFLTPDRAGKQLASALWRRRASWRSKTNESRGSDFVTGDINAINI